MSRARLVSHLFQWQSSFSAGGVSIAHVASYLHAGHAPQRAHVVAAAEDLASLILPARFGAHGWTERDARNLTRMVAELRAMVPHVEGES